MAYELIAAVDLGSNSFRLQVGRVVENQIYPLDGLKEPVRLASGLTKTNELDEDSRMRALQTLARFGERLRRFSPETVRAVATNTLRVAKNTAGFLAEAEATLGFPIEIISGHEEARLIYVGVTHALPPARHRRLVVDIGGGSTEAIIGSGHSPRLLESLHMGCVNYSLRFFPEGEVNKKSMRTAELSAAATLSGIAQAYLHCGWREAIGSSGSAHALSDLLEQNGLNPNSETGITREGLQRLRALLLQAGNTARLKLEGLRSERVPVLAGGLAIMNAVFETLDIEHMRYADGALRLGVLYDLLGRTHHDDMRDTTVAQLMDRYQVDMRQAERVERSACHFLAQLHGEEKKKPKKTGTRAEESLFLAWAARLHEIGISVSHGAYHKHGAYILSFADLPGFSAREQHRIAWLVLYHRGKLDKLTQLFPMMGAHKISEHKREEQLMVFSLRLAVLLHRGRNPQMSPSGFCRVRHEHREEGEKFILELSPGWLEEHPLSAVELEDERSSWQRVGIELEIRPGAFCKEA
ncbi:MAG: exopolyphosphatase [Betaproteobacteria bacterium]|nr:exopolyphosphatase [Betaproteobacteria bacterium]